MTVWEWLEKECSPRVVVVGFVVFVMAVAWVWAVAMFGGGYGDTPRDVTPATAPAVQPAPLNGDGRP